MTEVDTSSGELHNEEALMETFPSRRISTQAIDRLPKHAELRRHALKRWTLLLGGIDIELLLKHATSISRTPLESQTFVKLLYRRLPVSHYTKSKAIDAKKCRRCGFEDETISHAIYECQQSALFWTQIHACLKQLLSQEIDEITLRDVVYFFPNLRKRLGRDQLHVLNVVHSVALFVLWSSSYEYERHGIDFNWETFNMRLRARIEIEYNESVRIDAPPASPTASSSNGGSIESMSPATASLFVFPSIDASTPRLDSAIDSQFTFSPVDKKLPGSPQGLSAGLEATSFLNRWCSTGVTIDSNSKVLLFGDVAFNAE